MDGLYDVTIRIRTNLSLGRSTKSIASEVAAAVIPTLECVARTGCSDPLAPCIIDWMCVGEPNMDVDELRRWLSGQHLPERTGLPEEKGYYWVETRNQPGCWHVAEYLGDGIWYFFGDNDRLSSEESEVILYDTRRIERR